MPADDNILYTASEILCAPNLVISVGVLHTGRVPPKLRNRRKRSVEVWGLVAQICVTELEAGRFRCDAQ